MRQMLPRSCRPLLSKRRRAFWLKRGGLVLLLLFGLALGLFGVSGVAQAASGCEHEHVAQGYRCIVEVGAGACLRERNVTTFAIEACVSRGTIVYVVGQVRLTDHTVSGSAIWDLLNNGRMVSDYYVNTGHYNAFSPPIPNPTMKPTPTPPNTPSATATPSGR